jgi:pre-mRNA-splicing factor SYF1
MSDATNGDTRKGDGDERTDAMAALERQARAPQGFVPASTGPEGGNIPQEDKVILTNPDAIDVDVMGDD